MTDGLKPQIELKKPELTPGLAGYREEVQMEQEKRIPILSIDIQIRFRGALYEIRLRDVIKWTFGFLVVGLRLYRRLHSSSS